MTALPFVTADLPGSGGALRRTPEDFRVDEVPAYLPSGEGTHLYLRVEKRGRTTRDAIRALAAALGVPERDAGYAGLKDREAVTTQWLSFPVARDPEPAALESPGLRVLEVSRHVSSRPTRPTTQVYATVFTEVNTVSGNFPLPRSLLWWYNSIHRGTPRVVRVGWRRS